MEAMIHTWYETPNPLEKEAVVTAAERDFKSCLWTAWKRTTAETPLAHTIQVLLSVRVLGALMGLDGPAQPPLGPPPTLPAQGRRGSISALPWAFSPCLSYAADVFVSGSLETYPLPGHEPHWSPAHGPTSWPDLGPASSPWTCLTVTVPHLSILSRSPKTDFQRVTHEEQAKKCRRWQYATLCMSIWDAIHFDAGPSVNLEMEVWDVSIGQPQKNDLYYLYIVEIKKVTKPGLIKCSTGKCQYFTTENSFISRGNTTHGFGRQRVTCRFASMLTGREGINS